MSPECIADLCLEVLLDASGIEDFEPGHVVKVAAFDGERCAGEATAVFDAGGLAIAALFVPGPPRDLRVVVGPQHASTGQLQAIRTLCVEVPARKWNGAGMLRLPRIALSGFHWWWWLVSPIFGKRHFLG